MAVYQLPPRDTAANPAEKKQQIEASVFKIDQYINLLDLTPGAVAEVDNEKGDAIAASLRFLHKQLRYEVDKLFELM